VLDVAERLVEEPAPIAEPVIREHLFDGDSHTAEPGLHHLPALGSRLFALVPQDLGVGQPAVVIDGRVDEAAAETDAELRAEGYNPSLQDVIAVEQHLKSERNEVALIAGGLIVGLHVMARQANGKPGI